jgi:hypothetical protein
MSIIAPAGTSQAPDTVTQSPPLATQANPAHTPPAAAVPAPPLPAAAAAHDRGPQGINQSGAAGTIVNTVG